MSRRPDVAWGTLPRTGASTREAPFGNRAAAAWTSCGPTVDMSIRTWPGERAGASPSDPNRTCSSASGVASIVMTKSAPRCGSRPTIHGRPGANVWPSACPSHPGPGIRSSPCLLSPLPLRDSPNETDQPLRRFCRDVDEVDRERVVVIDLNLLRFRVPAHLGGRNQFPFALAVLVDMEFDQRELVLHRPRAVGHFPERDLAVRGCAVGSWATGV